MIYKSAVDWWFWATLVLTAIVLLAIFRMLLEAGQVAGLVTVGITAVIGIGMPLWLVYSTHYEISESQLIIRSGPFEWVVDRDSIQSIEPSRSVLSSPALSLDRLEIRYASGKTILVSPEDKAGFLREFSFPAD